MDFTYRGSFVNAGNIMSWTEYVRQFPVEDALFYIDPSKEYGAAWIKPSELLAYVREKMILDPVLYSQAEIVWQYKTEDGGIKTVYAPSLEEAYKQAKRDFPESLLSEFERVIAP